MSDGQSASVPPHGDDRGSTWQSFCAAVQFLTRVPLQSGPVSAGALRGSPVYFPLVGGLIGASMAAVIWLGMLVWPGWLAVMVGLAVEAWLTGGMHEDAVADFCDAFGGGWTRERILEILKDSRVGSYGVLGLLAAVGLRCGATIALIGSHNASPLEWVAALIAGSAVGRWSMVLAMATVAPVSNREGLARDVGRRVTPVDLALASFWGLLCLLPFAVVHPWHLLLSTIVVSLMIWRFLAVVQAKIGGTTGDCLGCLGYLVHVAFLLTAAARLRSGGPA